MVKDKLAPVKLVHDRSFPLSVSLSNLHSSVAELPPKYLGSFLLTDFVDNNQFHNMSVLGPRSAKKSMTTGLKEEEIFKKTVLIIVFVIVIFFAFKSYWELPKQADLYQVIDNDDYQALLFLSTLPKAKVMAIPRISTAIYPVSQHKPVATYFFYGKRKKAEKFFLSDSCKTKEKILNKLNVKYVLSKFEIDCGWNLIYSKRDYIYEID